jgi:predicted ArsR family transcriptional regulator
MKIKSGEYITVKEMADILKITTNTVNQRLFQNGIKPISKDALYEISALEIIKDTTMGRPKKPETETKPNKSSTAKKPAKGKK